MSKRQEKGQKVTLNSMIFAIYGCELLWATFLCFISETAVWVNLLLLKYFVDWIESGNDAWEGWMYAILFSVTIMIGNLSRTLYIFNISKTAMVVNRGVSSLLYQKITLLSQKSLALATSGKLMTLISSELQDFEKNMWGMSYVIIMPLSLIATFVYFAFLYYEASAIAFIATLLILVIIVALGMKSMSYRYNQGK